MSLLQQWEFEESGMTLSYCRLDIPFSPENHLDKINFFHIEISATHFLYAMYLSTPIHSTRYTLEQKLRLASIIKISNV